MNTKGNWSYLDVVNFKDKTKSAPRRKYTTPCNSCAASKIKCDSQLPCRRCVKKNIECSFQRFNKRRWSSSTPTDHEKERQETPREKSNTMNQLGSKPPIKLGTKSQIIPKDKLIPFLRIYKTWYYGNWPILPVNHLMKKLNDLDPSSETLATEEEVLCYSLSCSVTGAIANQLTFLRSDNPINIIPVPKLDASKVIEESIRARNLIDYRLNPNINNAFISFFYYIYYVNIKDGMSCGLMYMKEAIIFTQLLKLHDPNIYKSKSELEIHILTKFYYMLSISERYMCIEQNLPVCLECSIPFPALECDENPALLLGFIELAKTFSLPDRGFFDKLTNYYSNKAHINTAKGSWIPNKSWICNIHEKLNQIESNYASGETQSINVILSKHWMRSLVWNISLQCDLLMENSESPYLSYTYPIDIAKEFLNETKSFPDFAFESNGPGLCVKVLEIANGIANSINCYNSLESLPILQQVFSIVSKYKSDITIPQNIYLKVQDIIIMKSKDFEANLRNDNRASYFDFRTMDPGLQFPSTMNSPSTLLTIADQSLVEINFFCNSPK